MRTRRSLVIAAVSLAIVGTGCSGSSPYMMRGPKAPPPVGTPGVATVVFCRPSTFAFTENLRIVDHLGRFVGDAVAGSYFVVRPPPGEYVFIVGDDAIDVLYANLSPGLVYVVDVAPVPGSFTAKAVFHSIRPTASAWGSLRERFRDRELVPAYERGQGAVDRDPGLRARIELAKKKWATLPPSERGAHSIGPNDGAPEIDQTPGIY